MEVSLHEFGPPDLGTAREEAKAMEIEMKEPRHTWTTYADTTGKIQFKTVNMEEEINPEANALLWRGR